MAVTEIVAVTAGVGQADWRIDGQHDPPHASFDERLGRRGIRLVVMPVGEIAADRVIELVAPPATPARGAPTTTDG